MNIKIVIATLLLVSGSIALSMEHDGYENSENRAGLEALAQLAAERCLPLEYEDRAALYAQEEALKAQSAQAEKQIQIRRAMFAQAGDISDRMWIYDNLLMPQIAQRNNLKKQRIKIKRKRDEKLENIQELLRLSQIEPLPQL